MSEFRENSSSKSFIEAIEKFNPYHADDGKFTSASGGGFATADGKVVQGKYSPDKKVAAALAKKAVEEAKNREPAITKALTDAAKSVGGTMEGLDFKLKTETSLERKLISDQKEKGVDGEKALSEIRDINRYTMIHDEEHLAGAAKDSLSKLESQGFKVERIKNTLGNPDAVYRGMNCVVRSPDGGLFELQFHTKTSLSVKEVNHKLYEEQRLDKTTKQRRAELDAEMKANTKSIPTPDNIDSIKSFSNL